MSELPPTPPSLPSPRRPNEQEPDAGFAIWVIILLCILGTAVLKNFALRQEDAAVGWMAPTLAMWGLSCAAVAASLVIALRGRPDKWAGEEYLAKERRFKWWARRVIVLGTALFILLSIWLWEMRLRHPYYANLWKSEEGLAWTLGVLLLLGGMVGWWLKPEREVVVAKQTMRWGAHTHSFRRPLERVLAFVTVCLVVMYLVGLFNALTAGRQLSAQTLIVPGGLLASAVVIWVFSRALRAFAMPCNRWTVWLLILSVCVIGYPWVIVGISQSMDGEQEVSMIVVAITGMLLGFGLHLAGQFFPMHRRLKMYWKPSRLPYLRPPRGLTLIELLIDVAILAIMAAGIVNVTSTLHRAAVARQMRADAAQLAEDQFALMRARGGVDAQAGDTLALDEALRERPLASAARVEIAAGPDARLREARVHIMLANEAGTATMTLARLMPVAGGKQ